MSKQHYHVSTYHAQNSVGYLTKRSHSLMLDVLEPLLVERGLSFVQYVILSWLRDGIAVTAREFCTKYRHDTGAITRVIDQLEERGLVERTRGDKDLIQLNATLTAGLRGFGSDPTEFDNKRFKAMENFISLRSDLSYTYDLPDGAQLFAKGQGQISDQPLVSSEQFSAGGLDTVRGYLESEVLGDNGVAGSIELRSPDLGSMIQHQMKDETGQGPARFTAFNEWRIFGFADAAEAQVIAFDFRRIDEDFNQRARRGQFV